MVYVGYIPPGQAERQGQTLRVVLLGEFTKYIFLRKLIRGNSPERHASGDLLIDGILVRNTVELIEHTVSATPLRFYVVGAGVDPQAVATYTAGCDIRMHFARDRMLNTTYNLQTTGGGGGGSGNSSEEISINLDFYKGGGGNDAEIIMQNVLSAYLCNRALQRRPPAPAHPALTLRSFDLWLKRLWMILLCQGGP